MRARGAEADHLLVFVGGLHRTGTTLLTRCLSDHPQVSGFRATGVSEDEGQHLQSVYPPAGAFGGPGRFAFEPESHLTEGSPLVSDLSRRRLLSEWGRYWELDRPVLLEKSPPNLIRTRFLHALFPGARFIMTIRHPIAVAYATRKWSRTTLASLIAHWLVAYETLLADARHVPDVQVVRYESLVAQPSTELADAFSFLDLGPVDSGPRVKRGLNDGYLRRWTRRRRIDPLKRLYLDRIASRYEERVNRFGYSLTEPDRPPLPSGELAAYLDGSRRRR